MSSADSHSVVHVDIPGDTVRLVQITDTHLSSERGGKLLGMDTDHSLQAVIDLARNERQRIDLVLGTGDLADNGDPDAYRRLLEYFAQFSCNSYLLPGNHDDRAAMADRCSGSCAMGRELRAGNWRIFMLDSQIPGAVGGELGEEELTWLDAALLGADQDDCHSLVVLHHHPVPVNCAWLDEQIVADADDFFEVVGRHSSVRAVLWGHVHQELDQMTDGVRLLASPSTCVQFAPNSAEFAAEETPPGYRWLDLHANGAIDTGVSRATDLKFTVNVDQGGYL